MVEGTAQRIVAGDVPESLRGKTLYALDLGAMVAGAKYRGEFEERLKAVLEEIKDSDGQIVTFIDELHTVVGAGAGGEGAMDAGNMLKPMLAVVNCAWSAPPRWMSTANTSRRTRAGAAVPAGAGGRTERRGFHCDPARHQGEVRGHHKVSIADQALVAAASLSDRYITSRFLPDKAIDLMDEAASRLRMEIDSAPVEIDELQRAVDRLHMEEMALSKETDEASKARLDKLSKDLADKEERLRTLRAQWSRRSPGSTTSAS